VSSEHDEAMTRLQPLKKDDLAGEQADLYDALVGKALGRSESFALNDRGEVRGPIAVLLHHPASGRPLRELATVLRFQGLLPAQAREAVILVVAAHWRDAHEWSSHESLAREAGMTDEQLEAVHTGGDVSFDDPVTKAALDAARAIVTRGDLTDDEYTRAHGVLGDARLVEVTVLIGYYGLLAMQLRVFRIPV
jgi:4-carboxymuconolactone decarboxylase